MYKTSRGRPPRPPTPMKLFLVVFVLGTRVLCLAAKGVSINRVSVTRGFSFHNNVYVAPIEFHRSFHISETCNEMKRVKVRLGTSVVREQ